MSTKTDLLALLSKNCGKYISGESIANQLGISRAAINKAATSLRKEGFLISSKTKVGYCLLEEAHILTKVAIEQELTEKCNITLLDTVDSTNNYAINEDLSNGPIAIIADSQSKGRGRLGRTFVSPKGTGLYISIAFKPEFQLDKSLYITMASAVATARAIEEVSGKSPKIKWVNDLFIDQKKVCGILTEAKTNFETGRIDGIIIGIGINCFPTKLPVELKEIAGSISDKKDAFSRSTLAARVISNVISMAKTFENKEFLKDYKKKCFILGKNIEVLKLGEDTPIKARALDIDDNGGLVIEYMEGRNMREIETLRSGEVSLRTDFY